MDLKGTVNLILSDKSLLKEICKKVFIKVDKNHDKVIDFEEFKDYIKEITIGFNLNIPQEELEKLFILADKDKNNLITEDEAEDLFIYVLTTFKNK